MTREVLAERMGVTVKCIYDWEAGRTWPRELFRLIDEVGSTPDQFWSFPLSPENSHAAEGFTE